MIEVQLDINDPKQWKATGEYRAAGDNEPYFGANGYVYRGETEDPVIIAAKVEPARESRWINVYPPNDVNPKAHYHGTMEGAITSQGDRGPLPLLRIDYEDGKPVRVAFDPAPPLAP